MYVTESLPSQGTPLRVSDLVPLRRMLGTDSIVIRVNPDGSFAPFERMPALFFEQPIRDLIASGFAGRFEAACATAIDLGTPVSFRPDLTKADELLINPVLANDESECRFLVCWVRHNHAASQHKGSPSWDELDLDDVAVRYRVRSGPDTTVVEAAPWWALRQGELVELWPQHAHVAATGLGHAVMQSLIIDAAEAAAEHPSGPPIRITVPSADMLACLVPVFHGVIAAAGIEPDRLIVAVHVDLAVDPDLLPIIVHLRTLGLQIDIVGLDALTANLHMVSDTSTYSPIHEPIAEAQVGPWMASYADALAQAA